MSARRSESPADVLLSMQMARDSTTDLIDSPSLRTPVREKRPLVERESAVKSDDDIQVSAVGVDPEDVTPQIEDERPMEFAGAVVDAEEEIPREKVQEEREKVQEEIALDVIDPEPQKNQEEEKGSRFSQSPLLKIDAFAKNPRRGSLIGLIMTVLLLGGLVAYGVILYIENETTVITSVKMLPSENCFTAKFKCTASRGCTAQALGPETVKLSPGLSSVQNVAASGSVAFALCPNGTEGMHIGPKSDVIQLDAKEQSVSASCADSTYAYFGAKGVPYCSIISTLTSTLISTLISTVSPGIISRVRLSDLTRIDAITLNTGENDVICMTRVGTKIFVGIGKDMDPVPSIVTIDTTTFTRIPGSLPLPEKGVITGCTADDSYAYFSWNPEVMPPAPIVVKSTKISPTGPFSMVANATMQGEGVPKAGVVAGSYILWGYDHHSMIGYPLPPWLVRTDKSLNTAGNLTLLPHPENGYEAVSTGFAGKSEAYSYWATTVVNVESAAHIVKVDNNAMSVEKILTLEDGYKTVVSSTVDSDGKYGYFGIDFSNGYGRILQVQLSDLTIVREYECTRGDAIKKLTTAVFTDGEIYFSGGGQGVGSRVKRLSLDLGASESWGELWIDQNSATSPAVIIPPISGMSSTSLTVRDTIDIKNKLSYSIFVSSPVTPLLSLYPCRLNNQRRCLVLNQATTATNVRQSRQYSLLTAAGALGGFAGLLRSVFNPLVGVIAKIFKIELNPVALQSKV